MASSSYKVRVIYEVAVWQEGVCHAAAPGVRLLLVEIDPAAPSHYAVKDRLAIDGIERAVPGYVPFLPAPMLLVLLVSVLPFV